MAIKLTTTYSKKLGLPGFSSHMFEVSVETELATTDDVAGESRRLYHLLQSHVDNQIIQTGFVPPADYGMDPKAGNLPGQDATSARRWKCSDKQQALIFRIIGERKLDKKDVEEFANRRFGKGVRMLSRKEASGLIDALLETSPPVADKKGNPSRARAGQTPQGREAA